MKEIKLGRSNFVTLVDNEDFEWLSRWKWHLSSHGYVISTFHGKGHKKVYMHRLINNTLKGVITDHINQNQLDNRKLNLRNATKFQNATNSGIWRNNTSGIKGVSWNKKVEKWETYITKNSKHIFLGYFINIKKAIDARKKGEERYWAI